MKKITNTREFYRRWGRLGVLLLIKESYLFTKNVFGLGVHPVKTLSRINREKDRSQQLLVWGLPIYVLVMGIGFVWLGRRWLGTSVEWGVGAKLTSLIVLMLTGVLGGYLGYWWIRVWRAGKCE